MHKPCLQSAGSLCCHSAKLIRADTCRAPDVGTPRQPNEDDISLFALIMHARYVRRGHASSQPFRGNTTTPAEVQGRFPATASDDMHSLTHTHAVTHSLTHSSSKADVVVLVFPAFKHQYLDNQLPFPLGVMCTVPDAAKEGFHLAATGLEGGGERRGPPPCFRACKPVGRRGRRFSAKSAGYRFVTHPLPGQ